MYKRPVLVSILGGYTSLFNVGAILFNLKAVFASDDPAYKLDPNGDLILSSLSPMVLLAVAVIGFVCAVNILEGANWSRWLYAATSIGLIIYELVAFTSYPALVYLGIISRAVFIVILFLPDANEFFRQESM